MTARILVTAVTAALIVAISAGSASARTWKCHGRVAQATPSSQSWLLHTARNTTCANAWKVFVEISRWSDHTRLDLGAPQHPNTLGYSCKATVLGDAFWRLTCTCGSHVIIGLTAD